MALQGVLQRMSTASATRSTPTSTTSRSSAHRRARLGLAVRGAPPLAALHPRQGHHRRRAVLPRRLADPRRQRLSLGREGLPTMPREEDAAREIVLLLDGALRSEVVFSSESLTDHLTQNAVRVRPLERVGVLTAELPPPAQRRCTRSCARTWRTTRGRWRAAGARASRGAGGIARTRFGWAGSTRPVCLTTTGCRDRRSCSSSTTPATAAPTSTASGATSSATSGATCCRRRST